MVWLALQQMLGGHNQKVLASLINHSCCCKLNSDGGETPLHLLHPVLKYCGHVRKTSVMVFCLAFHLLNKEVRCVLSHQNIPDGRVK